MTAAPPRAPSPARYAQGDRVLACGLPAEVAVVYPADRHGRRLYGVEFDPGIVGLLDEADLAPAAAS